MADIDFNPLDPESRKRCQHRALELCQVIYQHEGNEVPSDVRSQAYWLAGTISLDLGGIDAALHLGEQAMQYAFETSADKRCLYDAAELLRQVVHR